MIALSSMPMAMQVLCTYPVDAGHTRETIDYYLAEGTGDDQVSEYKELGDLRPVRGCGAMRIGAARFVRRRYREGDADAIAREGHPALPEIGASLLE